jgi:hypothetical protein
LARPADELTIGADERLRDALSQLLDAGAQQATVLDDEGRRLGTLSLATITEFLHPARERIA